METREEKALHAKERANKAFEKKMATINEFVDRALQMGTNVADYAVKHPKQAAVLGVVTVSGIILVSTSQILVNATMLGVLTTTSYAIIFNYLPEKVQLWALRHPLATEITSTVLAYSLMGGGVTALIGAGIAGILQSIYMSWKATDPKLIELMETQLDKEEKEVPLDAIPADA